MIETERLLLRGWIESDKAPFHLMCNDPGVMEYLGAPMTLAEVDMVMARQNGLIADIGYCFWAVERKADGAFLGCCGIKPGPLDSPIEGRIEIGWRLAVAYWGHGYAHEASQASIDWAWANTPDDHVWAITNIGNRRSWGLMERLGMIRRPELDFDLLQPDLEARLMPHITYSIGRPA